MADLAAAHDQQSEFQRVQDAFRNKKVFVTGHTGFKGAWLTTWLSRLGAEVAGFSLEPDAGQRRLFDLAHELAPVEWSHIADIRDQALLDEAIGSFQPDIVFHLAAQPLVRLSYEAPVETFDVNVRGTAAVLEAVRLHNVSAVVCVTTDKCYENTEQIWPYRESDPMGGWDPYSASKGAAELVVQSFRRSFFGPDSGVACASARGGNVVGGGDLSTDRLVPDVFRAMQAGSPIVLRRPDATRPWQHVLESLSGYLALGAALLAPGFDYAEAWNFGPDPSERTTVGTFVQQLVDRLGDNGPTVEIQSDGPHEAGLLALDITKAATRLNWSPQLTMGERIWLTAEWMLADFDGSLSPQMLEAQLDWFEEVWAGGT